MKLRPQTSERNRTRVPPKHFLKLLLVYTHQVKDFNPANKEHFSSAADTGMTGHFTQVVWRETTNVGCGISSYPDGDFTCSVSSSV